MNKEDFLKILHQGIKKLPPEEREDIIQDYEEHFDFGLAEGKSEEKIVQSLGSPTQIAKEILTNYHLDQVNTSTTLGNILRATWAVISLSFFNLIIVLSPAIAIAALILSGWIVGISFFVAPIFVIVDAIVHSSGLFLFHFFISLAICGVGYFIILGMLFVTKFTVNGFIRYLKYNASMVKGGLVRNE